MSNFQKEVTPEIFFSHVPFFEKEAQEIAGALASMSAEEISLRVRISFSLAVKAKCMCYDFPNKTTGLPAMKAYTGEVFKAFDFPSLSIDEQKFAQNKIGIISSMYGYLEPSDIIKPYRFDFSSSTSPTGDAIWKYWKKQLTSFFINYLKKNNENEIVNLLPADASKCLDWKVIEQFAEVVRIDFKTPVDNSLLKTPPSGKLKELRGKFLRKIIEERIDKIEHLLCLESSDFMAAPELYKPGLATFIA